MAPKRWDAGCFEEAQASSSGLNPATA